MSSECRCLRHRNEAIFSGIPFAIHDDVPMEKKEERGEFVQFTVKVCKREWKVAQIMCGADDERQFCVSCVNFASRNVIFIHRRFFFEIVAWLKFCDSFDSLRRWMGRIGGWEVDVMVDA